MSEWRPIETAPKDGTRVLIFVSDERGITGIFMAEWDEGGDIEPDDDSFYPAWFVCESMDECMLIRLTHTGARG
jgi:hypothetical protein